VFFTFVNYNLKYRKDFIERTASVAIWTPLCGVRLYDWSWSRTRLFRLQFRLKRLESNHNDQQTGM